MVIYKQFDEKKTHTQKMNEKEWMMVHESGILLFIASNFLNKI